MNLQGGWNPQQTGNPQNNVSNPAPRTANPQLRAYSPQYQQPVAPRKKRPKQFALSPQQQKALNVANGLQIEPISIQSMIERQQAMQQQFAQLYQDYLAQVQKPSVIDHIQALGSARSKLTPAPVDPVRGVVGRGFRIRESDQNMPIHTGREKYDMEPLFDQAGKLKIVPRLGTSYI